MICILLYSNVKIWNKIKTNMQKKRFLGFEIWIFIVLLKYLRYYLFSFLLFLTFFTEMEQRTYFSVLSKVNMAVNSGFRLSASCWVLFKLMESTILVKTYEILSLGILVWEKKCSLFYFNIVFPINSYFCMT